ncbi:MAG: S9 family peptidase, partial [Syntrophales bacterium]|nr:S9 family peptidase [Syntrophales bacterium]
SVAPKRITANPAAEMEPRFSPDGKFLAYLAASRPGNEADRFRIILRDLATGKERYLDLRADDKQNGDRSPDSLVWSRDGRKIYTTADHLGQHALFAVDVKTGRCSILMKTGAVAFPRPTPDGSVLFGWSSLQRPMELYLAGPEGAENRRISKLNDDRMAAVRLGKVGALSFQGTGGRMVHGRVIFPADFDNTRKYPVAFLIHGGPQTSDLNEFDFRWNPQVFAGAGYAVVAIDFPGSTGYGQSFTDAIHNDWGGAPFEELLTGIDAALKQYPCLDRERIGALGPSFGGYMVQWIAGHKHPFRCLVSHAGIFDREGFFYQTDELWFAEWEDGGMPRQNQQGYQRHSPSYLVNNWQTPTLIIHGEKDFRVPYTQGLSAFTALQRRGITSKLLIFPDEGHWILKPHNTLLWYQTVLSWLDRWLKTE